jgi:anti-sigma regulatory factor (Ser/Thr protein kinase)
MTAGAHTHANGFEHEALLYAGVDEFVERIAAFVAEGVEAHEPVMVMVGRAKIDGLRAALGADGAGVVFADMEEAGRNPARIIPAWRRFADEHSEPGRPLRGVGEPIWHGRGPAELVECQTHETLLNTAFADAGAFRLLCPYDTIALAPDVLEEARRGHPIVSDGEVRWGSASFAPPARRCGLDKPLSEPPAGAREVRFGLDTISSARAAVAAEAGGAGLGEDRVADLTLAVGEVAANSVRHGGGHGTLRVWREPDAIVCEVRDAGRIDDALAGRVRPEPLATSGHGLWIANELCDLVQLRSFPDGAAVRMHMRTT